MSDRKEYKAAWYQLNKERINKRRGNGIHGNSLVHRLRELKCEEFITNNENKLIRVKELGKLIPIAKSTIWAWVKMGKFPQPVKLGSTTCWKMSDIQNFINSL